MNRIVMMPVFALAVLTVACSEPLVFREWQLDVPAGTPVHEYAAVATAQRVEGRIELREDLVIGDRPVDEERFYRIGGLAVDGVGNLYVNDAGNHRIQVFDAAGGFVRSIGREGQGPGELLRPTSITVANGGVVVADQVGRRVSWWNAAGIFEGSTLIPENDLRISGLPDGSLVASYQVLHRTAGVAEVQAGRRFVRIATTGEEVVQYGELPLPWETTPSVPISPPEVAVGSESAVYLMHGDEYQILALDASGEARWALRTSWRARPIPLEDIERYERVRRRRHEDSDPVGELATIDWPEHIPALSGIAVDGHGHVYVFPFVYLPLDLENPPEVPEWLPVDVYSSSGELLLTGEFPSHGDRNGGWKAAWGDFIYRTAADDETGDPRVVRYRLVEPFDGLGAGDRPSDQSSDSPQPPPPGVSMRIDVPA